MAKGEPLLKDLYIQNEYRVVGPSLSMPAAAAMFADSPGDALLVYDKGEDKFDGCLYLHDFNKAYGDPPKNLKGKIHKATIGDVMNYSIETIEWDANVSQAWALVTTRHPHGIILRDEKNRFAGFLSNDDLSKAKGKLDLAAEELD